MQEQLDLDAAVQKMLPWDFSVRFNGRQHAMRPPAFADLLQLQQVNSLGTQLKAIPELRKAVHDLFAKPPADFESWPDQAVALVCKTYMAYFRDITKKNAAAIGLEEPKAAAPVAPPTPASASA